MGEVKITVIDANWKMHTSTIPADAEFHSARYGDPSVLLHQDDNRNKTLTYYPDGLQHQNPTSLVYYPGYTDRGYEKFSSDGSIIRITHDK